MYYRHQLGYTYPDRCDVHMITVKHKAALKGGAITISNHVFKWDFLCMLKAIPPQVDLHVGEPPLPDKELSEVSAAKKLQEQAYHIIQVMNGIHSGDPTYNTD